MFLADIINYLSIDLLHGIFNLFFPLSDGSVFDAFSQILPPLTCPAPVPLSPVPTPAPGYSCGNECGGSAFYKEAAAFGTLGYYAQASWLIQIFDFGLQKIALIGYVISATATLYGFALGNVRPQKFLWFLIGPPICWFLIAELTPVKGVEWRVGNQFRDMREVWKMVEPGLANEDYIIRNGIAVRSNAAPVHAGVSFNQLCYAGGGDAYACVSDFFAYYDSLISDVVQQLVGMLGIGRAVDKHPSVANSDTNITWGHSGGAGGVNTGDPVDQNNLFKWDLISSIRWDFLVECRMQE